MIEKLRHWCTRISNKAMDQNRDWKHKIHTVLYNIKKTKVAILIKGEPDYLIAIG